MGGGLAGSCPATLISPSPSFSSCSRKAPSHDNLGFEAYEDDDYEGEVEGEDGPSGPPLSRGLSPDSKPGWGVPPLPSNVLYSAAQTGGGSPNLRTRREAESQAHPPHILAPAAEGSRWPLLHCLPSLSRP